MAGSRQTIDAPAVAGESRGRNARWTANFLERWWSKPHGDKQIETSVRSQAWPDRDNSFSMMQLGVSRGAAGDEKARPKSAKSLRLVLLARWLKFNFVGGIGIVVQFLALFVLKSVLHFDYLIATALAVEMAVVHNFVWHERFTWRDRVRPRVLPQDASGAKAPHLLEAGIAALKRCATQRLRSGRARYHFSHCASRSPRCPRGRDGSLDVIATQRHCGASFVRFLRFNATTGMVSIVGNIVLMKVMVGLGHINYLVANAIAIALCSVANFLVSDGWVFGE
jgi:putative flippase GtrA